MVTIKNNKIKYLILGICLFILCFTIGLYRSYHEIEIKRYLELNEKITDSINFVVMADLHSYIFAEDNNKIIENVKGINPDIIFMVGDMLNRDTEDTNVIIPLIEQLREIAPVYYALGNHELDWQKSHEEDLCIQLENAGAVVLDKIWCDIELNGQQIRIGGLYDYAFGFDNIDLSDSSNEKVQIYNFLTEFQNTDALKIMLSHRPDSFIFNDASKLWDIDLVISGHLHGGQVVLPILGGVYGGDQGWFPEYVHGMYEKDNMNILITSGLSTNKKMVPRWNNPPEIMVLELS